MLNISCCVLYESAGVHKYWYIITQNSSSHRVTRSIYPWRWWVSHWQRLEDISSVCHWKRTNTSTVSNLKICKAKILPYPANSFFDNKNTDVLCRYVFWYHNERMVNYDYERGVSVTTVKGASSLPSSGNPSMGSSSDSSDYGMAGNAVNSGRGVSSVDQSTKSRLIITEANPQDSGNYTCKPSNAVPASIQVFVSKNRGNQ